MEEFVMRMSYGGDQLWLGDKKGLIHLVDATDGDFNLVQVSYNFYLLWIIWDDWKSLWVKNICRTKEWEVISTVSGPGFPEAPKDECSSLVEVCC